MGHRSVPCLVPQEGTEVVGCSRRRPHPPHLSNRTKRGVWRVITACGSNIDDRPSISSHSLCPLLGPTGGDGGGAVLCRRPHPPHLSSRTKRGVWRAMMTLSATRRGQTGGNGDCGGFLPPATPSAPFKPNQAGGVAGYDDFECKEEETQTQTQTRNPCPEKSTTLGRIGSIVRKRSAPFKNSAMHTGLRPRHQRVSTQHSKT